MKDRVIKSDDEWKAQLSPQEFEVTRKHGTERPFANEYNACKDEGIYHCRCCGNELFASDTKFDSGTGWPSFWAPLNENSVSTKSDNKLFMRRIEVLCSACDAHLGHVFDDGPAPTRQRYCMNSASLKLAKKS